MPARPYVPYSPVEEVAPETQQPFDYLTVHATPEEMGGQIGAALQNTGQTLGRAAQETADVALKFSETANQTKALNALAAGSQQQGDLENDLHQLKGENAINSYPEYRQKLQKIQDDLAATMPNPQAKMMFLSRFSRYTAMTDRSMGVYVGSQYDEANIAALEGTANAAIGRVVRNGFTSDITPDLHELVDVSAQMGQKKGWPKAATDSYLQGLTSKTIGDLVSVKLASGDVDGAKAIYKSAVDSTAPGTDLPLLNGEAMAQIQNHIFQRELLGVRHNTNNTILSSVFGDFDKKYYGEVTSGTTQTPSAAGSFSNNLGNVKTASGAVSGTQDFINPATPTDGVVLAANNLRKNYQGLTLAQIGAKWAPDDSANWVKNVSVASGIAEDSVPNLNDAGQLTKLVSGIATAEKSQSDRAAFTDDIISRGVQASLSGAQPNISSGNGSEGSNFTPQQIFARNQPYTKPGVKNYITQLSPQDEQSFQAWAQKNGVRPDPPNDTQSDYDMRGFWKALQSGDPNARTAIDKNDGKIHFPDTWKTPYDLTFSGESIYANSNAPQWNEQGQLQTSDGKIVFDDKNRANYLTQNTPNTPIGTLPGQRPIMTQADYYRTHYNEILTAVQDQADKQYPNDPRYAQALVATAEGKIKQVIDAQTMRTAADQHLVEQGLLGVYSNGKKPVSADELRSLNPAISQAWDRLQIEDPNHALDIETHVFKDNAKTNVNYGPAFYRLLSDVYSGKITESKQLYSFVGEPQGITSDALGALSKEISNTRSPQGNAEAQMKDTFFKWAHSQISSQNGALGQFDPKGEELFQKFLAQALPAYDAGRAKGISPAVLLSQSGDHSLAAIVPNFMRSKAETISSTLASPDFSVGNIAGAELGTQTPVQQINIQDPIAVAQAFLHGKINRQQLQGLITGHPEWLSPQTGAQTAPSAPLVTR